MNSRDTGAVLALEAFHEAIEDMAREDIDGDAGTVTYAELKGGILAAIAAVKVADSIAVADAFTPPDPFSRKV